MFSRINYSAKPGHLHAIERDHCLENKQTNKDWTLFIPYREINYKWIIELHVRSGTLKLGTMMQMESFNICQSSQQKQNQQMRLY